MDCKVQIRVTRSATSVCLDTSGGAHTQELCHAQDKSKFLNVKQRLAVAKVCKVNQSATGGNVRRARNQLTPGGKVKKSLSRSVRSVVKIQKRASLSSLTEGVEVTNSYASIAALGDRLWFGDIIRRHNDDDDPFHFFTLTMLLSALTFYTRQLSHTIRALICSTAVEASIWDIETRQLLKLGT
jgi:hypothetical protein